MRESMMQTAIKAFFVKSFGGFKKSLHICNALQHLTLAENRRHSAVGFFYANTAHRRYSTAPVWNCNGTTAKVKGEEQRVSSTFFVPSRLFNF